MCRILLTVFHCRQPGCGVGVLQNVDRKPCPESTSLDKFPDQICPKGEKFKVLTPNRRWLCPNHGGTLPPMEGAAFVGAGHGNPYYERADTRLLGEDGRGSGQDFGSDGESTEWDVEGPCMNDGNLRTETPVPQSNLSHDDIRAWTEGLDPMAVPYNNRAGPCTLQEAIYRHTGLYEPRPYLHNYPQEHRYHPWHSGPMRERPYTGFDHLYQQALHHNTWTQHQAMPLPEPHPGPPDMYPPGHHEYPATPGDNGLAHGPVRARPALGPAAPIQRNGPMFLADPDYPSGHMQGGSGFGRGHGI